MNAFSRFLRVEFAPPHYLSLPTSGIDISTSGIKIATIVERTHGLELSAYDEFPLPAGAVVGGEIQDHDAVVVGLKSLAERNHIHTANVTLPEARGYLFEAVVPKGNGQEERIAVEQHLDEYVPLPSSEVIFDVASVGESNEGVRVVGTGYARRVVEDTLSVLDESRLRVRAIESETFSLPRAVLPRGDKETVLIIDIGKTTTKLLVVTKRIPRFVTTLDIGGHALTLAVMKYFGVSEEDAKKVKAEKGIAPGVGNEEYIAAMLGTVSVIRDEIVKRLEYWQSHAGGDPVTRVVLVGGNATVLGLPEYLEASLKVPVALGDVFANFAPKSAWLPPLAYTESLAYGTAIGLALREYP
ncbi:pilus assembly protein PilM [Candidatus Parcubacteria bacterium]|nr:pilus assembly protein PilM [Candidatus Parcubacteria bacterium]